MLDGKVRIRERSLPVFGLNGVQSFLGRVQDPADPAGQASTVPRAITMSIAFLYIKILPVEQRRRACDVSPVRNDTVPPCLPAQRVGVSPLAKPTDLERRDTTRLIHPRANMSSLGMIGSAATRITRMP